MHQKDRGHSDLEHGRRAGRDDVSGRHLRLVTPADAADPETAVLAEPRGAVSYRAVPRRTVPSDAGPHVAQVVHLPTASRQQRDRRPPWSRVCGALCVVVGLVQPLAWLALPDWWRTPFAGSLTPAHGALIAYAVVLLGLALAYVIALDRRSAGDTRGDADHEHLLRLNTVF